MSDNQAETDIAAATVAHNGDLRDRIAYAIAQADGDEPGMEPASCDYEMADAVIRELGLTLDEEMDVTNGQQMSDSDNLVVPVTTEQANKPNAPAGYWYDKDGTADDD